MIKGILKNCLINGISLAILGWFYNGVQMPFTVMDFLLNTLLLTIVLKITKPIFEIIFLPLNLLTFGFFRRLGIVFAFGLTIYLSNSLTITSFHFLGFKWGALQLNPFTASPFFSLLLASILLEVLRRLLQWLIKTR